MLIESRIRRVRYPLRPDGSGRDTVVGSTITMGKVMYRFYPQPKLTKGDTEAHVCLVTDKDHQERFLDIPEGFCEYGKPPRVKEEKPRIAQGQLPITDKIEDLDAISDDELAAADAPPKVPED
jgi:hypothetical protein